MSDGKKSATVWYIAVFAVAIVIIGWIVFGDNSGGTQHSHANANQSAAQAQQQQQAPIAPDFTLETVDGDSISLSDYRGKVVFVNFWATWCAPCRNEIPHFVDLIDKYGEQGFVILGISVDRPNDLEKIPAFMNEYKINYPVLKANGNVVAAYGGISSIPQTFVIGRDGRAVGRIEGSRPYEMFEQIVTSLL